MHSPLKKEWALKTKKKRTQFTEEQKKFLKEQFVIGEERGKKADQKEVSNECAKSGMNRGLAFFLAVMFFRLNRWRAFSLVWLPRSGRVHRSNMKNLYSGDEDHQNAAEKESLLSKLHAVVEVEIALRHPIVALSRNICNLVHDNKLSTLSVAMLREICESLGLNVDDITERKKKSLINRITRVVGECLCERI